MQKEVQEDIINVIETAIAAVRDMDTKVLSEISDHTLHNASIYQDKDSITIAVIMYALSKVIGRAAKDGYEQLLSDALDALKKNDVESYEHSMKNLIDDISAIDRKLDLYIQKVINEAQIKKGSRLYEHGISLAQTADLLGISQWELMKYIGNTRIADRFDDEIDVMERIKHTRGLFGL